MGNPRGNCRATPDRDSNRLCVCAYMNVWVNRYDVFTLDLSPFLLPSFPPFPCLFVSFRDVRNAFCLYNISYTTRSQMISSRPTSIAYCWFYRDRNNEFRRSTLVYLLHAVFTVIALYSCPS